MITKEQLLPLLRKEFATTLKVMRAYPEGKLDFKPHERSSHTKKLVSTFVFEMFLLNSNGLGKPIDPATYGTYDPENMTTLIADFEREADEVIRGVEGLDEAGYAKTITFANRTYVVDEFIMMMLHDQIHHRGQLSVYLRMAGGLVPSIYGPSADERETNL